MQHVEHTIQKLWVARVRSALPDLIVYAVPNGGARNPREGARLRAEGVLAGVPDVVVARAVSPFHGLYLEFKRPGGSASADQLGLHKALRREGYRVETVYSVEEAWDTLTGYLGGDVLAAVL